MRETDEQKNILCIGLNFSFKPGLIEYSEFLPSFEILFLDIKREDLCDEDMSKTRLSETALTSYQKFSSDWDQPEHSVVFIEEIICIWQSMGHYVISLDEYKLIGTYWIASYINGNIVTYFDSSGIEYIQK